MRVGIGYDSHRLVEGRGLILGGVEIPFSKGLLGHSDGDVVVHAVMDALLGAAGKQDIGTFFPNTDPKYKGISSLKLLGEVKGILEKEGFKVENIDIMLIAQEPRISPFISQMKQNIASVLGLYPALIAIKATTNEGMGFIGQGEGIAAIAVACVEKR